MKLLNILIAVFFAIVVFIPALQKPGKISPEVQRQIAAAAPTDHFKVILKFLEPSPLTALSLKGKSKAERHETVVRSLQKRSEESHPPILTTLLKNEKIGKARNIKRFWIVNAIAVEADSDAIRELVSKHSNIEILPDLPVILFSSTSLTQGTPGWNLSKVNAPALWGKGYTGQGMVVATLDTGVDVTHPDLRGSFRGGSNSWFDVFGVHPTPVDNAGPDLTGHGTGVMSLIVGGNASLNIGFSPGGPVGSVPNALWIAAKIFDDSGTSFTSNALSGLQWVADPDGNPATPDAPDIVNGSFGINESVSCITVWQGAIQNLQAIGILSIFASGNSTIPAIPGDYPESIAVGSTNSSDAIDSSSGQGPSFCRTAPGSVYPDLVAPGVLVPIALPGSGPFPNSLYYGTGTGTSFASPHVAGAAALLLSAFPEFKTTPDFIKTTLQNSALDLGAAGPDNTYGYGRLDVGAAFNTLLQTNVPRPPSVSIQNLSGGFQLTWGASPTTPVTYTVSRNGVPIPLATNVSQTSYLDTDVLSATSSSYSYSITASAGGLTSQATKGMLGNIHQGNGVTANRIDGFDLAYLIDLTGATPASSNWDAAVDLNGDEVIDSADLAILTAHFGQVMK